MVDGKTILIAPLAQGYNMEEILGTEIYEDMRLGHIWYEVAALQEVIQREQPAWFVEVGIHEGGLTWFLLNQYNFNYLGIEINCGIIRPKVKELIYAKDNADLICADCFSDKAMFPVSNLEGKKMIYCDGGDKAKELVAYADILDSGDVIMAHDFSDLERVVEGWPEYKDSTRPEVLPKDIEFLYRICDRIHEDILKNTRIIAFKKE